MIRIETPFPDFALPRVWTWAQQFRGRVFDDFAPATMDEFVATWRLRIGAEPSWLVSRDGEVGGVVLFRPETPVRGEMACLFKREFWLADGLVVEALRQVFGAIFFSGKEIEKVGVTVFRDNAHLLHFLRLLGGEKEGVLRANTRRGGRLVDQVVIGVTRADFERSTAVAAKEAA